MMLSKKMTLSKKGTGKLFEDIHHKEAPVMSLLSLQQIYHKNFKV
jgi:hypothetical protein